MTYTFDEIVFSDLHKDAYGFRPRGAAAWRVNAAHEFYDATPERKQEIWDLTLVDLDYELEREQAAKAKAVALFADRLQQTIDIGAGDRITALRWLTEGCDDFEHFVYEQGILFTNYGRDLLALLRENCREVNPV